MTAVVGIFVFFSMVYRSRGAFKILLPLMIPSAWLLGVVGFLPIIQNLVNVYNCDLETQTLVRGDKYAEKCYTVSHILRMILTFCIIFPYTMFTIRISRVDGLWNKLALEAPNILTRLFGSWAHDDYGGKPQNLHLFSKNPTMLTKIGVSIYLLKIVMIVGAVFLVNTLLPLAILNLIVSSLFFVFSIVFPPFINKHVNCIHMGAYASVLWTNVAALWTVVVNESAEKVVPGEDAPVSFYLFVGVWFGCLVGGYLLGLGLFAVLARSSSYQSRLQKINEKNERRRQRRRIMQNKLGEARKAGVGKGDRTQKDKAYLQAIAASQLATDKSVPLPNLKPKAPAIPPSALQGVSQAQLQQAYAKYLDEKKRGGGAQHHGRGGRRSSETESGVSSSDVNSDNSDSQPRRSGRGRGGRGHNRV